MKLKPVIRTTDNSEKEVSNAQMMNLLSIAGIPISELRSENLNSLLVVPGGFDECNDNLGDQTILDTKGKNTIRTGNVLGFISIGDTRLKIGSRFDAESALSEDKDYFLQYMLEKVLSLNIVDLKFGFEDESIYELLIYFFPIYLKRAFSQGLYREYQTFRHNDSCVKGVIDFSRHIQKNMPFNGNVAYKTREHSTDNDVTQLIRHTIEYIETREKVRNVLQCDAETKTAVSEIIASTPSYSKGKRSLIISKNLRPTIHPYYSEYRALQKLCVMILQHEEVRYGNNPEEVYGLLIDGAWLWENYLLVSILSKLHFEHADNIKKTNGKRVLEGKGLRLYPDFYLPGKIVLDAKYKFLEKVGSSGLKSVFKADDIQQVMSYMDIMKMDTGGFIFPSIQIDSPVHCHSIVNRGGKMYGIGVEIPQNINTYEEFCIAMNKNEQKALRKIVNIIN